MGEARDATSFTEAERRLLALAHDFAADMTQRVLQEVSDDSTRREEAVALVRARAAKRGIKLKLRGNRPTPVRTLGGQVISVNTSYAKARPRGGRPLDGRGAQGTGVYPVLDQLGDRGSDDTRAPALRRSLGLGGQLGELRPRTDARGRRGARPQDVPAHDLRGVRDGTPSSQGGDPGTERRPGPGRVRRATGRGGRGRRAHQHPPSSRGTPEEGRSQALRDRVAGAEGAHDLRTECGGQARPRGSPGRSLRAGRASLGQPSRWRRPCLPSRR